MRCPKCNQSNIRVSANITCYVVNASQASRGEPPELEPIDGYEPYIEPASFTLCVDCDHEGDAESFGLV